MTLKQKKTLDVVCEPMCESKNDVFEEEEHTTEGNAYCVSRTKEVLRQRRDAAAITDSDRAVIAVRVVVAWLLIVLELRGESHQQGQT